MNKVVRVKDRDILGIIMIEEKPYFNGEFYSLNNVLLENGETVMLMTDDFEEVGELEIDD